MEEERLSLALTRYVLARSVFLIWDIYSPSLGQDLPLGKEKKIFELIVYILFSLSF